MKLMLVGAGWILSLVASYYMGWFAGLKDAPSVAASSAHLMTSAIEYFAIAAIVLVVLAAGFFMVNRDKKTIGA